MTAALEELAEEVLLQDLDDVAPSCELKHVHEYRRVPVCAAELIIRSRPHCGCEEPSVYLICRGCDEFLLDIGRDRCTVCGLECSWAHSVIERTPL